MDKLAPLLFLTNKLIYNLISLNLLYPLLLPLWLPHPNHQNLKIKIYLDKINPIK